MPPLTKPTFYAIIQHPTYRSSRLFSSFVTWNHQHVATSTWKLPTNVLGTGMDSELSFTQHVMTSPKWKEKNNQIAIVEGTSGATRTFNELESNVTNASKALINMGIKRGDVVALLSPNHVDYFTAIHAICAAGGIVTMINPLYTDKELTHQLIASKAVGIISAPCGLQHAIKASKSVSAVKFIIGFDGEGMEDEATIPNTMQRFSKMRSGPDTTFTQPVVTFRDDVCVMPFSSGTTGLPKGVMLTHANIIANVHQCWHPEGRFFTTETVVMSPLPMFHIYAFLISLNATLYQGKPLVTMKKFDLENFCQLMEKYHCTRAHVVPPIILALGKSPLVDKYNMKSLQVLLSAAAPLGAEVADAAAKRLGCMVKQAWGMSEISPLGTMVPDDEWKKGSGSVGPPVADTQVKIVDASHKSLAVGEIGELCVKGPQVMKGYLNEPEKTRQCLTEDGWFYTGDIASLDEDGFVTIKDRAKELIKYKGFQVPPAELEALLCTHPAVLDAIVIPRPHEEAGEIPRAYVVKKEGTTHVTEQVLMDFVATQVAPHKKLRGGVVFVPSIPKTTSGKLLRRQVVEEDRKRKE